MSIRESVYAQLDQIAITSHRVTDPRTVPGKIVIDTDLDLWQEVTIENSGYFKIYVAKNEKPESAFRTNAVLVLTRFIVDNGIDLAGLTALSLDDACRLPDWVEETVTQWPRSSWHEGSTLLAGTYTNHGQTLYTVTKYVVYRRANVGYLLQITGTTTTEVAPQIGDSILQLVLNTRFEG